MFDKVLKTPLHFVPMFWYDDTAQKMTFSIKDFFSKCNQIRRKLQIWSHLLKESLMENFIFLCSVRPESVEKKTSIGRNWAIRGGSRTAATFKMEHFAIIVNEAVNYYHVVLHLGCSSSPRSASGYHVIILHTLSWCGVLIAYSSHGLLPF